MIETEIKNFIENNLPYHAYMEIPRETPDAFFIIEKLGGTRDEQIDAAVVAVQTYAPTMYKAAEISGTLINAMLNEFIAVPDITSVRLNSSYNYPDQRIEKYRYQSLFEIYYYGGNET